MVRRFLKTLFIVGYLSCMAVQAWSFINVASRVKAMPPISKEACAVYFDHYELTAATTFGFLVVFMIFTILDTQRAKLREGSESPDSRTSR